MQLSKEFSFVETVKGKVNTKGFKNFLSASSIVIKMETEDLTLKLLHLDYKEENGDPQERVLKWSGPYFTWYIWTHALEITDYFYVGNYFLNI